MKFFSNHHLVLLATIPLALIMKSPTRRATANSGKLPSPSQSFQPHNFDHLDLILHFTLLSACSPPSLHHPSTQNLLPRCLFLFLFQYNLLRQARRRQSSRCLHASWGRVSATRGFFALRLVVSNLDFLTFLLYVFEEGGGDSFALP